MNTRIKKNPASKLKAVIFDWAGTTVDYGCFAPTGVFIEVFSQMGIDITIEEARRPMGMQKRDHIRTIAQFPRIVKKWQEIHGSICDEDDIDTMFQKFIPLQLAEIEKYAEIIPELPDAIELIRSSDLKIGSTTGYNEQMMNILIPLAAKQGYKPDSIVCASDVPEGRPAPWMAFINAEILGIYPMQSIIKIGDTIADIQEGNNAGMWSVGVVESSNEMGLTLEELNRLSMFELQNRKKRVRDIFFSAGADYVIDKLDEVGELINTINQWLAIGDKP